MDGRESPSGNPTLGAGRFLLARPVLDGTPFEKSVVLLMQYGKDEGAMGFVVNRVVPMPINEILVGAEREPGRRRPVSIGGPVEPSSVRILEFRRVEDGSAPESAAGAEVRSAEDLVRELENPFAYIFMGYSGWSPRQLEREIADGCWEIWSADPAVILSDRDRLKGITPEQFKASYAPAVVRTVEEDEAPGSGDGL